MRSLALAAFASLVFAAIQIHGAATGRPLFLRDTTTAWLPLADTFVSCAAQGAVPLWDPYAAFGRPLLADPRAAVLYPLTWLNLLVEPAVYYALFAIGHVALGGLGLFLLARALGLTRPGAATAAGVWMAGGPFLSLVAMWSHLAGAAYIPWIVWAFVRVLERPSTRRVAAGALSLALQLVGGSPEMTALAALAVALCLLVRPAPIARLTPGRLAAVACAGLLGLALAAAQILPTLDVVSRSERWSLTRERAALWSLHPAAVAETLVPSRWIEQILTPAGALDVVDQREPFLRSIYLGAGACVLAAAALCRRRRDIRAPLAMVVSGVVLALGRHTPIYFWLVGRIPGVSGFRYPVKALLLAALGFSLLAGLGLDRLREGRRRERAAAAATAALLLAGTVAVALVVHGMAPLPAALRRWIEEPVAPAGWPLAVAMATLLGVALLAQRTGPSSRRAIALGALACLDLTYRHWDLNPTGDRRVWRHRPKTVDSLDVTGFARTFVRDYGNEPADPLAVTRAYRPLPVPMVFAPPEILYLGLQDYLRPPLGARWRVFGSFDADIVGFEPLPLVALQKRFLAAGRDEQLKLLRLTGVRNLLGLVPEPLWSAAEPVAEWPGFFVDPVRVFRVPAALPRAFVVDGVRVGDGPDALLDPSFAPEREVLLPAGAPRASGGAVGRAEVVALRCNAVAVEVETSVPAHLVLSDAYDPGWRATVDGAEAAVLRANVAFRAVAVAPGRHTVVLRYRPDALRTGSAVSFAALLAVGALLALPAWSRQGRATRPLAEGTSTEPS
jgi:hypothetical protein